MFKSHLVFNVVPINRLFSLLGFALIHLHHNEANEEANDDTTNGIEEHDHCAWSQASVPGLILRLKILHSHYVFKKASLWLAFFPEAPVKAIFE